MSFKPQQQLKQPKIERISLMQWLKGYESTLSDDRKDNAGLKLSENVLIYQNGTVRPRPSLVPYGDQAAGTILGEVYPYVDPVTALNWEICVMDVGGISQVYYRRDGLTWNPAIGKTYNLSAKCHFMQVNGEILIMNGQDNLSYFNIATQSVVPFTALAVPSISSVVETGLAGTDFEYGYCVSASNQGNTPASTPVTVTVNETRDQWTGYASGQYVTITWGRITGAQRYSLYVNTSDGTGLYYYLDTVPDPGTGTNVVYIDDSSVALNTNSLAPQGDSTAGPRVTRAENILGQVFMWNDTDNPYRVWFGATGQAALDFSTFDGGGWVDIDVGGRNFPASIKGFRDGHGDPVATAVFKGTSGRGKLIHLAMTSTTVGNTVITYAALEEANGQDGTISPDGVIFFDDALWYPSIDGFNTTGTSAEKQNILTTQKFTDQIQPDVYALSASQMEACVGIEFQQRLYWAVAVGSATNNQIWICDTSRGGLWTNPWFVEADWMWLYDDNSGNTHFMVLSKGIQYEFSYDQFTNDNGNAVIVDIGSGLIKFSPDGEDWGSVIDVTFVFENAQGEINMNVTGYTESSPSEQLGSSVYQSNNSTAGWDEIGGYWDNPKYCWDAVTTVPTSFPQERTEEIVEIGTEVKWLTWEVSSDTTGVDFQLADVVIRYVDIGVIDH